MVQMYVDLLWEFIPADALQDVDPQLRGGRMQTWYIKCRNCGGRAVCKELDDGTRIEFRITVPHRCDRRNWKYIEQLEHHPVLKISYGVCSP